MKLYRLNHYKGNHVIGKISKEQAIWIFRIDKDKRWRTPTIWIDHKNTMSHIKRRIRLILPRASQFHPLPTFNEAYHHQTCMKIIWEYKALYLNINPVTQV